MGLIGAKVRSIIIEFLDQEHWFGILLKNPPQGIYFHLLENDHPLYQVKWEQGTAILANFI